jgi:hypothetical protein
MGNILDIKSKRKPRSRPPNQAQKDPKEFNSEFTPDIDNFQGVKKIRNYCIASMLDNGYGTGDESAGVMQVYNKIDGNPIDKEDIARIHSISRFLGALAKKSQDITNSLTLVIGMT